MSDRSERDVTIEAQWSGGDAVAISGPGLVTGRTPGVAELTAVFGGHRVLGRVTVLPAGDVAGTYMLTITAADHCGVGLGEGHVPDQACVRTYTADVRHVGQELAVTLTGATFLLGTHSGHFWGRVEPGRLVFDLTWWDGDQPHIAEHLPDSRILVVHGQNAGKSAITSARRYGRDAYAYG
jgi:hypothetical protein